MFNEFLCSLFGHNWEISELYSHYRNTSYYNHVCSSDSYHQCIPYNDDTKHLVGSNKDCPEYYKTWE